MRVFQCLFFLIFWSLRISAQNFDFKHDWDMKYLENGIQLTSKKKAPIPFSMNGEPQAIMYIGATILNDSTKYELNQIVLDEIEEIRNDLSIADYLEEDYRAKNNIVSYFEKVNNVQIGIIKYRTSGVKNGQKTLPRNTRQILFIHNSKLWISSLIVLFAEDQDNIRSDQMTFVREIIKR